MHTRQIMRASLCKYS